LHRGTPGHMRLPHRLQGQKVKSQGGAGAYCGGDLAAQLVNVGENAYSNHVMITNVCRISDVKHRTIYMA